MWAARINARSFIPLLIFLCGAYGVSLWLANEALSILSSVMLAGCIAIFGSIYLARGYREKNVGGSGVIVAINFILTTILGFFLLRVLADVIVNSWS